MKIEINTQAKHVEVANMLLGMAIIAFKEQPEMMKKWKITKKEIEGAEMFQKKLINSFLKIRQS